MKKVLAILFSATLILLLTACGNKENPDDTTSTPTYTPNSSQSDNNENSQNNSQNNSQDNNQGNSQNNSQGGTQSNNSSTTNPLVVEDTNKEDITEYVPYGVTDNEGNTQYYPPEMDAGGQITPGVTVQGTKFELPEFFEVEKAIRICKAENTNVTIAKLTEFANEYAKAYNKYYTDSNYKLVVSVSGNIIKYTFTVSGKPAERSNTILQYYLGAHFDEVSDFYKAQAKKYKDANSSFSGIEVSVVRADSTNVITKKFS